MTGHTASRAEEADQKAGKYLAFVLADEQYGVEIGKVREIVAAMDITPVPRAPRHVQGVANLRGKIIPVVNLRRLFGMSEGEQTARTCIIVVDVGRVEIGILVDKVLEVLNISADDVDNMPSFGAEVDADVILGLAKTGRTVTILLDIEHVLRNNELTELKDGALSDSLGRTKELVGA